MSRIGILTFHRSLNYGAFLQAYSLSSRIRKDRPGDQVELIDYTSAHIQDKYSRNRLVYSFSSVSEWKRLGLVNTFKATCKNINNAFFKPDFMKKRKALSLAFDEALKLAGVSEDSICTDDYHKAIEWLRGRYDAIVVGSDCVWEFNNYPFPSVYYLKDLKNVIKFSYAACAQGILYESLTKEQISFMRDSWRQFDYIGVRDDATGALVKSVDGNLEYNHNCDPTVFLDLDQLPVDMDRMKNKFVSAGMDLTKPAVCLMGNTSVGKICREIVGDRFQIVAVYQENPYADFFVGDITPFEWAHCFSLFSLTFTNRFHGTLLSLKNGVSPVTFDFPANYSNFSNNGRTKIRDLYDRLGLTDGHYFVGKRNYEPEETEKIKNAVEKLLKEDEKERISTSLKEESRNYDGFMLKLSLALEKSQSEK